jgi:hypothetical protein
MWLDTPSSLSLDEDPSGALASYWAALTFGSSGASCWAALAISCCSSSAVGHAPTPVGWSNSGSFKASSKASCRCRETEVPYKQKQL